MPMKTATRRAFMRTFAGTSVAAIMLRHFVSSAAEAQFPLRFLFVFSHDGRDQAARCSGTGTNFTLGASFEPLQPWRDQLLVVDGLQIPDHVNEEHPNGRCAMLTGLPSTTAWTGQGISIDRLLATALSAGESIYTGVEAPGGSESLDPEISWHAAGIPNQAFVRGDKALLEALFHGVGGGTPLPPEGPDQSESRRQNELSLNSFLTEEVRRLERVAPAEEREKLRLHLEALSQLRATAEGPPSGGVLVPPKSCDEPVTLSANTEIDRTSEIIAHALACGRARIAVHNLDGYEPHHEFSHDAVPGAPSPLLDLDRVYSQHFANLLGYLAAFPEGDGSLLDNTIVVLSSEVSGTYGGDLHGTTNIPCLLAGGKNAGLRSGERLVTQGFWNTALYRAIALSMGVTDTSAFGDPARSSPFTEIFRS